MNLIFVKSSKGLQCHLDTRTAKVKSTFVGSSLSELVSESSAVGTKSKRKTTAYTIVVISMVTDKNR